MNNASISPSIGRYTLIRELGRGGMAIVYEAYDTAFERPVALKVLPNERLADEAMRARFLREARLIASLEHEAIVPVYDYGEEGGQPYFVMRYMTGGTLADRLARTVLSPTEAVALIERLAPALDEAHRRSIIHRDLKPANILFDESGLLYLSDFGIAKLVGDDQTAVSRMIGTPAYMSPEQISGRPVDGRSDLYGVGILLWEMLTGSVPFAGTALEVAQQHLVAPLPPLRAAHAELPPALEGVLQRALAKEPADRYASMAQFVRALRAAVPAPMPVKRAAAKVPASAGGTEPRKSRRALPLLWIVIGLALLSGIAAFLLAPQLLTADRSVPDPAGAAVALSERSTPSVASSTPLALAQAAPELPALPTRRAFITSTPVRLPPTATPVPSSTAAPIATQNAAVNPSAPSAGSPSRNVTLALMRPGAGDSVGQSASFSVSTAGLQAGDRLLLLVGPSRSLDGSNQRAVMQPSGGLFNATVSLAPGNYFWTAMLVDGSNRVVASAAPVRALTVVGSTPNPSPVPPTAIVAPPTAPPPTEPPPPPTAPPPVPTPPLPEPPQPTPEPTLPLPPPEPTTPPIDPQPTSTPILPPP